MSSMESNDRQPTGFTAQQIRIANALRREGNLPAAVLALELALSGCLADVPVMPATLCRRLASLYRALGRYDDEVRLLEHYRESQIDAANRMRFDARLREARALAERQRQARIPVAIAV
jgi:alpha-beta hydrolase superfamily lysophospholipase